MKTTLLRFLVFAIVIGLLTTPTLLANSNEQIAAEANSGSILTAEEYTLLASRLEPDDAFGFSNNLRTEATLAIARGFREVKSSNEQFARFMNEIPPFLANRVTLVLTGNESATTIEESVDVSCSHWSKTTIEDTISAVDEFMATPFTFSQAQEFIKKFPTCLRNDIVTMLAKSGRLQQFEELLWLVDQINFDTSFMTWLEALEEMVEAFFKIAPTQNQNEIFIDKFPTYLRSDIAEMVRKAKL